MQRRSAFAAILLALATFTLTGTAQSPTPPPAPALVEPASGAALVQPITLRWSAVNDPDGPIGSYTWQVGTTSSFTVVVASGFTDLSDGDPAPTQARVSGVQWHVFLASQGDADGWRSSGLHRLRVVGRRGASPSPASARRLGHAEHHQPGEWITVSHVRDLFDHLGCGAGRPLLSARGGRRPNFSYPHTLTVNPMTFGTRFGAGWGNEIPNIYYRVRAVSVDNVIGPPSPAVNVKITNGAPVPPPPTPLSPGGWRDRLAPVHVRLVGHRQSANPGIRPRRG